MASSFFLFRLFKRKGSSRKSERSEQSRQTSSNITSWSKNKMSSVSTSSSSQQNSEDFAASQYRYDEQGRRYHNRSDAAYILPNDDEEIDRLHMQHWILKISFQSNFGSPVKEQLEEGINVLDGGCGPGTWSLEMAKDYPQSKFTGIDISEAFPTEIKPSNCNFQVHNVNDPLPFSQNHFDYIFQRLLVVGIKEDDWDNVISQYMHVLKPGGWLELLEALLPECVNPGPKLELLMNTLAEMIETKGVNPRIAHSIKDRMKKAGIEKINVKYVRIPVHHGGKIGELFWQDFVMGIRDVVRPVIIKKIPELEDPDAYTNFIEECGKECDELKTYIKFYRFYGQKPTTIIA